jgi:tetratricopeptide (TPR) repeat protein
VKKYLAVLLIVIAVFACYAPALRDGFVWDDTALILRDPLIRSWRLIPEGFNHFLFVDATASDFYRPIQRLTETVEYAAFAFWPAPYHFTNIFLHAAAALAFFFFAEELLGLFDVASNKRRTIAFFAALVWAVHPVHNAAVVYISGRADPLAALFGFLSLYLILRSRGVSRGASLFLWTAATGALVLSALSRETGLMFPLIALTLSALRRNWSAVAKTAVAGVFVAAIYLSLRMAAEHVRPPTFHPAPPLLVRPILIARAVAEYAGLIVFPRNLHMERDIDIHPVTFTPASWTATAWRELQTLLGLVLIAALVYWAIRARKRNPSVFMALVIAGISYLPISGLFTLNASVAEHWVYVPSAFLFLAAALQLSSAIAWRRSIRRRTDSPWRTTRVAQLAFALWLAFLGTRTFVRTFDWRDQRTFIGRTIAAGGDSTRMLINLGELDLNEGKLQDAVVHLHAALQKQPDQPFAIVDLAAVALKQNDFKRARQLLVRASEMPPVAAHAHELLAVLEFKEKNRVDLLRLRLAARTGAPIWSIEKRYVEALDATGATERAIAELKTSLATEWYRAESWQLLGQLFAKTGHNAEAAEARARASAYDVRLNYHGSSS